MFNRFVGWTNLPWHVLRLVIHHGPAWVGTDGLPIANFRPTTGARKMAGARYRYYHLLRRWQCFVLDVASPLNRSTVTRSSASAIKPTKTPKAFAKACS